eukprot:jgi/Botrbrau1/7660/Bobra.0159s0102.1
MRQAGRYMAAFREYSTKIAFRERSETRRSPLRLSLQPWRAFKPDGVIMFSDILTPLPALGIDFDMKHKQGPVISQPISSKEQVKALRPLEDPDEELPFIRPILQALRAEVGDGATTLGFIGAPWTLAAYAIEGKADKSCVRTKTMMFREPALLKAVLDHITEAMIRYAIHQIDCGAQVVQLFDSWAHHLSPAQYAEFSLPYANRVMTAVRAARPQAPLIFHANGGTGKLELIGGCAADVVGLDWQTEMGAAREILGSDIRVQGNVDPMVLFGTEETVREAVATCCRRAGPKGHILNVGHGVQQGTPEENVGLFCQLARESASLFADARQPVHA